MQPMRLCSVASNGFFQWQNFAVCLLAMQQSFNRMSSGSTLADKALKTLSSLINYEQRGVPRGAGTTASSEFSLHRMHRLLDRLGRPHEQWPVVHVAGSKGKGSTACMITQILRSAGYRVGLYTSPHLHHISERISSQNGCHISHNAFSKLVLNHEQLIQQAQQAEGGALSHFEVVTALAFRHFADVAVDVAVVEVGLGGITDATNVFTPDKVAAAVITPIGMEHAEALGGTLQSIATAKAGIMQPGRPVVLAQQQHPEALQVLMDQAAALNCRVVHAGKQVSIQHQGYAWVPVSTASSPSVREQLAVSVAPSSGLENERLELGSVSMGLIGPHQHTNVATAVATAGLLQEAGWKVSAESIKHGLESASIPGRFQVCHVSNTMGHGAQHVVMDGAHTAESASALSKTLRSVFPKAPVALIVAMASDKEHRAVLSELRAMRPKVVVFCSTPVAGSHQRSASPGALAAQWQAAGMLCNGPAFRCRELIQASMTAAIEKAKHELTAFPEPGVICITGSLHAVAQGHKAMVSDAAGT